MKNEILKLNTELNDLIETSIKTPHTSFKAIIEIHRTDISKYPPFLFEVDIKIAQNLNATKKWEDVKVVLGDIFGDDITEISIRIPLKKKDTEYYLRLSPNRPPFNGVLSTVEC